MDADKNYKYVIRKEAALELADVSLEEKSWQRKARLLLDRILFGKPHIALILFVFFIALPISIIAVILKDVQVHQVKDVYVYESRDDGISILTPNRVFEKSYKFEGNQVQNVEINEIVSPDWFVQSYFDKEGKAVGYRGKPEEEISDRFVLLAKAKRSSYYECSGCDEDDKFSYYLVEYNLSTRKCESVPIWGRNPLGYENPFDDKSYCKRFENECLVSSSWRYFTSQEDCANELNPPQITSDISDEIVIFEADCDGTFLRDSIRVDKQMKAIDQDGEIVRFSVSSQYSDLISVTQDSIETIIRQITSGKGEKYYEREYKALASLEVTVDDIGSTIPITIRACDPLGQCDLRYMNVSVSQKDICNNELPETGGTPHITLSSPVEGETITGDVPIVWTLGGFDAYDVRVDLLGKDCDSFIKKLYLGEKLTLNGNKGFAKAWDSTLVSDGQYCLRAYMKKNGVAGAWNESDSKTITIDNSNHRPKFTSTPSVDLITTGQQFEYRIDVMDDDGDDIDISIIDLPEWLSFDGEKLSGTTAVPGGYILTVVASDGNGGISRQFVDINVTPPLNNATSFELNFPHGASVLAGSSNEISWEARDEDGISNVDIYFSADRQKWHKITSLAGGKRTTVWDTTNLKSGLYYLQFIIEDESDQQVQSVFVSDEFYISNNQLSSGGGSFPSIENVTPQPNVEIYNNMPLIFASIFPSDSGQIVTNQLSIQLDAKTIAKACVVSEKSISCTLDGSLEIGQHKVRVEVKDSRDRSIVEEWLFTIIDEKKPIAGILDMSEPNAIIFGVRTPIPVSILTAIIVVICVAILFTGIPLLLYSIASALSTRIRKARAVVPPKASELETLQI